MYKCLLYTLCLISTSLTLGRQMTVVTNDDTHCTSCALLQFTLYYYICGLLVARIRKAGAGWRGKGVKTRKMVTAKILSQASFLASHCSNH